jgi:hypothetical protein
VLLLPTAAPSSGIYPTGCMVELPVTTTTACSILPQSGDRLQVERRLRGSDRQVVHFRCKLFLFEVHWEFPRTDRGREREGGGGGYRAEATAVEH